MDDPRPWIDFIPTSPEDINVSPEDKSSRGYNWNSSKRKGTPKEDDRISSFTLDAAGTRSSADAPSIRVLSIRAQQREKVLQDREKARTSLLKALEDKQNALSQRRWIRDEKERARKDKCAEIERKEEHRKHSEAGLIKNDEQRAQTIISLMKKDLLEGGQDASGHIRELIREEDMAEQGSKTQAQQREKEVELLKEEVVAIELELKDLDMAIEKDKEELDYQQNLIAKRELEWQIVDASLQPQDYEAGDELMNEILKEIDLHLGEDPKIINPEREKEYLKHETLKGLASGHRSDSCQSQEKSSRAATTAVDGSTVLRTEASRAKLVQTSEDQKMIMAKEARLDLDTAKEVIAPATIVRKPDLDAFTVRRKPQP